MNWKRCFKCGENQPIENFYAHPKMSDGRVNKCISCNKKDVIENRERNLDYYKEYDKRRANLPHRVEGRQRYAETHPEVIQRLKRKWANANSEKVKEVHREYKRKYPEKTIAHSAVGNAVRDGRLIKQSCEKCGREDSQAHHDDYSRPLDVRWLCSKHHAEHHKNERRLASAEQG